MKGYTLSLITFFSLCSHRILSQTLNTYKDSISYSAGLSLARSFQKHGISNLDLTLLTKAIKDVFSENSDAILMDRAVGEKLFNQYIKESKQKAELDFLAENAKKPGVIVLTSGLQYSILHQAEGGTKPTPQDHVETHYHGTLIDGTVFDSSVAKGQPSIFQVSKVIKGWTEGLQLMSPGDKYTFYIPSHLAYGDRGAGGRIPPNATLIFDVELISIVKSAQGN
ncbi:MAG: FKBP-type peptidyl-prolyl cis-trans isomerase [Saprospiraceae bacterium]